MSNYNKDEILDKVKARKKKLEAWMLDKKADTSSDIRAKSDEMKSELEDVQNKIKDGADKLTDDALQSLQSWLEKTDKYIDENRSNA